MRVLVLLLLPLLLAAGLSDEVQYCDYTAGIAYDTGLDLADCTTDCATDTLAACQDDSAGVRRIRYETTTGGAGESQWNITDCSTGNYEAILVTHPGLWGPGFSEDWDVAGMSDFCVILMGGWAGGWWHAGNDTDDGGTITAGRRVAAAFERIIEDVNVDDKPVMLAGSSGGCLALSMCPWVYGDECEVAPDIVYFGCVSGGTHYDAEQQCNAPSCGPSDCVDNDNGTIGATGSAAGWLAARKTEVDNAEPGGVNCVAGTASNLPTYSLEQNFGIPHGANGMFWVGTQDVGGDDDTNGVVWGAGHLQAESNRTGLWVWHEETGCGHGQGLDISSAASCTTALQDALKAALGTAEVAGGSIGGGGAMN